RKFARYSMTFGLDAARDVTGGTNMDHSIGYDTSGAPDGTESWVESMSVPKGNFDNAGVFAQGEAYLHTQWTLSYGGRYTHYRARVEGQPQFGFVARNVDNDALCGTAGLVYSPQANLHVSANVANGYRQPNAQDLFFSGAASVGYVIGNPDLKPERSVSSDVGLRWGPGPFAISGSFFFSTYDDLIDAVLVPPVPAAGGQPTYQDVNISTARMWGGEGEGEWRFHPQWTVRAQAAGAVGDITSADAIQQLYGVTADTAPLPNVPPFRGSAALRWRDKTDRFWVE